MNIQQALDVSNRSVSFRDAEVLLAHALKTDRSWLSSHADQELSADQEKTYQHFLERRERNEPVAYIIGYKEFYGRSFEVDARVLIPRPETELAIERALAFLSSQENPRVLELGTGSGNIAVTLALEVPNATLLATDISAEALEIAQKNWQKLQGSQSAKNLSFIKASLFNHPNIQGPYDLIITNLPYVSSTWKSDPAAQQDVVFYEPDIALFAGQDGLDIYKDFFAKAPEYIAKTGKVILEYNENQTKEMQELAKKAFPDATIAVHQDYAHLDRVLEITP